MESLSPGLRMAANFSPPHSVQVGWVFSQARGQRDYIISGDEVADMARVQAEVGKHAATCVVGMETSEDGQTHVLFEVGSYSLWVSRLSTPAGQEVFFLLL